MTTICWFLFQGFSAVSRSILRFRQIRVLWTSWSWTEICLERRVRLRCPGRASWGCLIALATVSARWPTRWMNQIRFVRSLSVAVH